MILVRTDHPCLRMGCHSEPVDGEPDGGGSCTFPVWRSSVVSPGSVVAASRMEVISELPPAVALIYDELPALPPPVVVGHDEVRLRTSAAGCNGLR
jgi:hypothetical protein